MFLLLVIYISILLAWSYHLENKRVKFTFGIGTEVFGIGTEVHNFDLMFKTTIFDGIKTEVHNSIFPLTYPQLLLVSCLESYVELPGEMVVIQNSHPQTLLLPASTFEWLLI